MVQQIERVTVLEGYYSLAEASRVLKVNRQHVCRLARGGELPYMVTPNGRIYPRAEIDRIALERRERNRRKDERRD